MKMRIYQFVIFICLISLSYAIRNTGDDDTDISRQRITKAVSFFPKEATTSDTEIVTTSNDFTSNKNSNNNNNYNDVDDDDNDFNDGISQSRASFRFSDDQRDSRLNQNEIQNIQPQFKYLQKPRRFKSGPLPSGENFRQPIYYNLGNFPGDPNLYQNQPNPYAGTYNYYPNPNINGINYNRPAQYQFQQFPIYPQPYPFDLNYANQYENYRPPGSSSGISGGIGSIGNSISNFLSNFQQQQQQNDGFNGGAPFGQLGNVGSQFGQAIENIARFDDLQCVPKILCQMVGNPNRQTQLPSFLNAPTLTTLIAAVPSSSPVLIYGRAALLGLTGGEQSCDASYPRCPRNEDDVLYYLNNHRGGFFRFFNGGAVYGDDNYLGNYQSQRPGNQQYQYQQQDQQYQQDQYQQNYGQSTISNLGILQTLANSINQGGGINLSNLGSNLGVLGNIASLVGTMNGNGGNSNQNFGSVVGNLLTGLVGNRFSSRKISKRSVKVDEENEKKNNNSNLEKLLLSISEDSQFHAKTTSRKRNLNEQIGNENGLEFKPVSKKKKYTVAMEKKVLQDQLKKSTGTANIEPRVVNTKGSPEAEERIMNTVNYQRPTDQGHSQVFFPVSNDYQIKSPPQFVHENRVPKIFNEQSTNLRFPVSSTASNGENTRLTKTIKFIDFLPSNPTNPVIYFSQHENQDGIILDIPHPLPLEYYDRTKMIFPDRTGTGNLRFDNEYFKSGNQNRYSRILTGTRYPQQHQGNYQLDNNRAVSNNNNGDIVVLHNNQNYYSQSTTRYPSAANYNYNPYSDAGFSNRYTTNYHQTQSAAARPPDRNVYVTNSQGVVEYYVNENGDKIRV